MIRRGINYAAQAGTTATLLDLYIPDGVARPPLVVWIHGGGFISGDRVNLPDTYPPGSVFRELNAAGLACASIDYRLAPQHPYPAAVEDVCAAIAFLSANPDARGERSDRSKRSGYDPDRIGVWGESAGGMLALTAGLTVPEVLTMVAWYPVTDFLGFPDTPGHREVEAALFGAPTGADDVAERAAAASPLNQVAALSSSVASWASCLLVHGEEDAVVPVEQSLRMHERLLAAGADSTLKLVPGADHCFDRHPDVPGLLKETVTYLAERLSGPPD